MAVSGISEPHNGGCDTHAESRAVRRRTGLTRTTRRVLFITLAAVALSSCRTTSDGRTPVVAFGQSSSQVQAYDFIEVTATVAAPRAANPFTDASFRGVFETTDGAKQWAVDGFCDASNGSVFRIRFSPPAAGDYRYTVTYSQNGATITKSGTIHATNGHRRGPIRVDAAHPWHFVWEGTGEHYFFSGTTAYWLFGWTSDSVIDASLDRLHALQVNRIRVTIAGRPSLLYGEPAIADSKWSPYVTPWPARDPKDVYRPGFDYSRFFLPYWQKIDRAVRYARDRDIVVALAFDMNDNPVHPVAGSDDERRFLRYAVARLGAFSNVTWDLGDDLDGYRDNAWAERTGEQVRSWDPAKHLITTHPRDPFTEAQPRTSDWVGFTSFQDWTRTQHAFMLRQRAVQAATGHIIPQTNEEYGYEDHYPMWAPAPDSESADMLRRTAWGISMAGGYQLTGETAKRGTNVWPNTGGGWLNGRGDSTMTMLVGYARMIKFFTTFDWWTLDPHDELTSVGAYCLSLPGHTYAVYLPHAGRAEVHLKPGRYRARWYDPTSGTWTELPLVVGSHWRSPAVPDPTHDWALLLERIP